jgi:DnaJ-class molecular chaperone
MSDAHNKLGVAADASAEEIKRAYRQRAQKAHPDRGGSAEAFRAINEAYRHLTGRDERQEATDDELLATIMQAMCDIGESVDESTTDLIAAVTQGVQRSMAIAESAKDTHRAKIRKLERMRDRVRGSDPRLRMMFDVRIANELRNIEVQDHRLEQMRRLLAILKTFSYKTDTVTVVTVHDGSLLGSIYRFSAT